MEPAVSAEQNDAYIKKLAEMPARMAEYLRGFADKTTTRISPEDFSLTEHTCHLRDLEIEGYLTRIKRILAEENPSLPDFEGGRIAREREYNNQDANHALRDFTSARAESVRVLASLESAQFEKTGNLDGVGNVSIQGLLHLMLEHDQDHVRQLEELAKHL